MTQMMRYLVLNLLGLALATFGAYAAFGNYPSVAELAAVCRMMPTIWTVLAFGLSIAVAVIGLGLLVQSLLRLRRRQATTLYPGALNAINRGIAAPRPVSVRHERGIDEDFDYGGHGTGSGYDSAYAGRHHDNGEYAEFDDRRRAGGYR